MAEYPTLPDLMRTYFRDSVDEIKEALKNLTEVSVDTGIADATSTVNQLDDVAKNWPVNAFQNLIVEITKGTGAGELRKIASNTATALLPVTPWTVAPDATSEYRVAFFGKMSSDITHWGGTALTGRDVSTDLQALTDDGIKGILKSLGDVGAGDNIATVLAAIQTAVEIIDDWDAVHGSAAGADGPQIMIEGTDFTGSAFPRSVNEGDAARPVGSLNRVLYTMLTSPDGAQSPYDEIENVLKVIEQANARQQSVSVEIQSATVITAAETVIGGPINTLGFNTISFFVDYSKGDETSYDLIMKMLRVNGGDEHPYGTWSAGATKTWTDEIFRQTASAKVYITLDVTGINILKIYGDATGGTPTGTCELSYLLTNN